MVATRRTRSSSSASGSKRIKVEGEKLCVIVAPIEGFTYEYYIYMINPCGKETPKDPNFKLTDGFYYRMATAVFNGTLYMFGGYDVDRDCFITESYAYSLCSKAALESPSLSDFTPKSPMASLKVYPRAVIIGNKICVFPRILAFKDKNFELYDPNTDQWSCLPKFPREPKQDQTKFGSNYEVLNYGVEDLVLYVSTRLGSFRIDLGQRKPRWVTCTLPPNPPASFTYPIKNPQPFLEDGCLAFSPDFIVYNLKHPSPKPILDYSLLREQDFLLSDQIIFNLPKEDNERKRVLIIHSGGYKPIPQFGLPEDDTPDVFLKLYTLKFNNDGDASRVTQPTIINTRLISLANIRIPYGRTFFCGVFPF